MKRVGCFVVIAFLACADALAQGPDAAAALDHALNMQKALPGYVEHLQGPAPVSLPQPGQPPTALGPAREIGAIEHAGELRREVFPAHNTEIVRGKGRTAMLLDLTPQIAELHVAAGMVGEGRAEELTNVGVSTTLIVRELVRGGFNILGDAMDLFDSLSQLRSIARSIDQILKLAASMEKLSGQWHCQVDSGSGTYTGPGVSVRQLADESIADVTTHVYLGSRAFTFPARPGTRAARDDDDAPPPSFELQCSNCSTGCGYASPTACRSAPSFRRRASRRSARSSRTRWSSPSCFRSAPI